MKDERLWTMENRQWTIDNGQKTKFDFKQSEQLLYVWVLSVVALAGSVEGGDFGLTFSGIFEPK